MGLKKDIWWRIGKIILLASVSLLFIRIVTSFFGTYHDPVLITLVSALLASAFLCEGVRYINRRIDKKISWQANPVRRFFIQFFWDVLFILFFSVGVKLLILIYFLHMNIGTFFRQEVVINSVIVFITLVVVLGDLCIFLIRRWRYSLVELEISKREKLQFQFEMLRNQINPHFLFNSLNTLNSLIYSDSDKAADFTRQLAQIFRNVLEMQHKEMVTLREELNLVEAYIKMIRIRFGQNIEININTDSAEFDKHLPFMTTQLLIENALNHNIISNADPLKIAIYTEEGFLIIRNSLQLKKEPQHSTGLGLKNIIHRYRIMGVNGVEVIKNEESFSVRLPLILAL